MYKYHGYLLACIISVWVVVLTYMLRNWLRERRALARGELGGTPPHRQRHGALASGRR